MPRFNSPAPPALLQAFPHLLHMGHQVQEPLLVKCTGIPFLLFESSKYQSFIKSWDMAASSEMRERLWGGGSVQMSGRFGDPQNE